MQKDVDIDRKQLQCDMLYSMKNEIEIRKVMSIKQDATPGPRNSRKKGKRQQEDVPRSSNSEE